MRLEAILLAGLLETGLVRNLFSDEHARHADLHIRFGPNATHLPASKWETLDS